MAKKFLNGIDVVGSVTASPTAILANWTGTKDSSHFPAGDGTMQTAGSAVMPVFVQATGTVDGSNTTFTIPTSSTIVTVFLNGVSGEDFTVVNGTTFTLAAAPQVLNGIADKVHVLYVPGTATSIKYAALSGSVNDSNTTFTLPETAASVLSIFLNGVAGEPFSFSAPTTVTLTTAPSAIAGSDTVAALYTV